MRYSGRAFAFICLFFISGLLSLVAQDMLTTHSKKAEKLYREAYGSYQKYDYQNALDLLEKAIVADPNFIEAYLVTGEIYRELKKNEMAIPYYKKVIEMDPGFFPNAYMILSELQFQTGRYAKAIESIKQYKIQISIDDKKIKQVNELLERYEYAQQLVTHPVDFSPENLGESINTKYDEYWPSLTADESALIVTVLKPVEMDNPSGKEIRQEDFYISYKKNGVWTPFESLEGSLNTMENEGAQAISADGKFLFFTACQRADGMGRCDIYVSRNEGNGWISSKNIGSPVNTSAWEAQPSLSPDGRTLYFASNRPGGKGGMDIWMSTFVNGTWNAPENLGDHINTAGDEMSPFIHFDNSTLYFSSNGHKGLGGHDMFMVRKDSLEDWDIPVNMGYPVNTHSDEFGLTINAKGNTAFFSSNRGGSKDIYTFELSVGFRPSPVSYVQGKVYDVKTGKGLNARCDLIDLASGEAVMQAGADLSGDYLVCLPGGKNYALNISKEGYLFFSEHFDLPENSYTVPYRMDAPMVPVIPGGKTILRNVFFAHDSDILKSASRVELDLVFEFLHNNPQIVLEIGGHTDNAGSVAYNVNLSQKRALAVVNYLIKKGINASHLVAKGYGMDSPVATNETEEGKARNRRTEIKILEK